MWWFKRTKAMTVFNDFIVTRNTRRPKPLSNTSIRHYRHVLGKLESWPAFHSIQTFDKNAAKEYIEYLQSFLSENTVVSQYKMLKCFFSECVDMGIIEVNPMASVRLASPKTKNKPAYPIAELRQRFLAACENDRDRLFITSMSYTGARIGELAALKWQDINFKDHTLMVDGKTGERIVPIAKNFMTTLKANKNGTLHLFYNRRGGEKPICKEWLSTTLIEIAAKAGMPQVTSHSFRRSVATHLLRVTGDAKVVAAILGMTVEVLLKYYVDADLDRRKEVMEQL